MSKMGSQYDLLIGTVYISPENSSSFSEEDTFSILENEILQFKEQLHNTEIIIMGDMNGYTKTENDFLTENINCHDGFSTVTGNLKLSERANMDVRKVNNYGRKILDMC